MLRKPNTERSRPMQLDILAAFEAGMSFSSRLPFLSASWKSARRGRNVQEATGGPGG